MKKDIIKKGWIGLACFGLLLGSVSCSQPTDISGLQKEIEALKKQTAELEAKQGKGTDVSPTAGADPSFKIDFDLQGAPGVEPVATAISVDQYTEKAVFQLSFKGLDYATFAKNGVKVSYDFDSNSIALFGGTAKLAPRCKLDALAGDTVFTVVGLKEASFARIVVVLTDANGTKVEKYVPVSIKKRDLASFLTYTSNATNCDAVAGCNVTTGSVSLKLEFDKEKAISNKIDWGFAVMLKKSAGDTSDLVNKVVFRIGTTNHMVNTDTTYVPTFGDVEGTFNRPVTDSGSVKVDATYMSAYTGDSYVKALRYNFQ